MSNLKPQWTVAVAREVEGGDTFWTTIGAGWNSKGGGISINLDAHPIGNRIMVFPAKEKGEKGEVNKNSDTRAPRR